MTSDDAKSAFFVTADIAIKVIVAALTAGVIALTAQVLSNKESISNHDLRLKSEEKRIDSIERSRFKDTDAAKLVEAFRGVVRDEVDRAIEPLKEDIQEMKAKVKN